MLSDSYIVPEGSVQPRSFGGLMVLYESNFIKLNNLTGGLDQLRGPIVSYCPADFPLQLCVDEATKYTRVLRLTYLIEDGEACVVDPDLRLRVYLDARLAEVSGWASHHRHGVLLNLRRRYGRELDHRWSRNMMLSKWLDYLADNGHSFRLPVRQASEAAALLD
ncbi:MAG: DUF1249 domain-containing protein [Gammaproteobacteria bacterium]|nr:DUF1249 domain-containing protein [Gammaproteobacteria bacterium]